MKIKTKLKIIVFSLLLFTSVFTLLVSLSIRSYRLALQKNEVANEIAVKAVQKRLLADDYLLNPGERSKTQWYAQEDFLENLITKNQAIFDSPAEKILITNIGNSLKGSRSIFDQITVLSQTPPEPGTIIPQYERELINELTIKTQETISDSSKLVTINNQMSANLLTWIIVLFSVASLLYLFILVVSFLLITAGANKLDAEKTKAETILSSIGDGVFVIDNEQKIVLFNKAASQISGFSVEEALGKPYKEILKFHVEDQETEQVEFIERALQGQTATMANHTVLVMKNRDRLSVSDSSAPLIDSDGKISGAVVIFRDVSKDRVLERLKDEFVSVASYELRTPLTAIKGLISMILDEDYGSISENLKKPMADVAFSTDRLINLVNDLLEVSRIESGKTKFIFADLSMNEIVSQLLSTLQPLAKQKGITLESKSIPSVSVRGDTDKIQQILNNILGNSIKFTDKGNITVSAESDNELLRIFITDTGTGISPENQKKLFEKFQQGNSSEVGRPEGTGLGLYLSRELAKKMGGDVRLVKSEVGKGSTFEFSIPLVKSEHA